MIKKFTLMFFFFLMTPCFASAYFIDQKTLPRDMESRAEGLFKVTRCLICSGESLYESKSSFAREMRDYIRNEILKGFTDEEILENLRKIYGEQILINRAYRGGANFLWIIPVFVAITAAICMISKFYRIQKKS